MRLVLLALLACGGAADPADGAAAEPLTLRVWLDGPPRAGGGELVVQAEYDPDGAISLPEPVAEGLTFVPDGPPTTERIGERDVITQRFLFRGAKGSYEIPALEAKWTGPEGESVAKSTAVFVDIETKPPREGELVDIADPPRVRNVPWAGVAALGLLLAGGVYLAFRPRKVRELPAEPPVPPDLAALRAWDAVRNDPNLTAEQKAQRLSALFRVYVEAVLGFEATSRTTTEILEHLQSLVHLPEGNVPRARRVLRATDRVKFADERPEEEWLVELDADLRGFVESTRPSAWSTRATEGRAAPDGGAP